jgi:hypothetical protein
MDRDLSSRNTTARTLQCANHNCSCSSPNMSTLDSESTRSYAVVGSSYYHSMSSTITIEGTSWELLAPPLNVRLRGFTDLPDWLLDESPQETRYWQNSSSFWADAQTGLARFERVSEDTYMHNETVLKEFIVKETGRCIAEDAYAWGFSSLLLLTFCCYTFLFALALILLQTDIYWNSRHDRDRQSHSIYTDMLSDLTSKPTCSRPKHSRKGSESGSKASVWTFANFRCRDGMNGDSPERPSVLIAKPRLRQHYQMPTIQRLSFAT